MTRQQFITQVEATQEAFRRFLVALCCGDSETADDLAQESYLKAYLSLNSLRDPNRFKSWIYKIGYNTYLNNKRAKKASIDFSDESNLISEYSSDANYRFEDLYDALNKLSAKERTSFLLYYMEGYAIKEIASIVGASESGVKQHLSRGRIHLKKLLSK